MSERLHQEIDDQPILPEGEPLVLNEWEQGLAFLFAGIAMLLGVVLLLTGSSAHSHLGGPLRPVLGLVWIGIGVFFVQSGRAGLIVEQDGITLRGIIRRRRWAWQEIQGFEIKFVMYYPSLKITLNDGAHARAPGFRGRTAKDRELADRRVAELNRRVDAVRPAADDDLGP
jgi:hypothetical protein